MQCASSYQAGVGNKKGSTVTQIGNIPRLLSNYFP